MEKMEAHSKKVEQASRHDFSLLISHQWKMRGMSSMLACLSFAPFTANSSLIHQ